MKRENKTEAWVYTSIYNNIINHHIRTTKTTTKPSHMKEINIQQSVTYLKLSKFQFTPLQPPPSYLLLPPPAQVLWWLLLELGQTKSLLSLFC